MLRTIFGLLFLSFPHLYVSFYYEKFYYEIFMFLPQLLVVSRTSAVACDVLLALWCVGVGHCLLFSCMLVTLLLFLMLV